MNPGSKVIVPDDESGDCVFVRAGDDYEALEVDDPAGGRHTRDVGLVRYPDGCIKPWPYAKIRAICIPLGR